MKDSYKPKLCESVGEGARGCCAGGGLWKAVLLIRLRSKTGGGVIVIITVRGKGDLFVPFHGCHSTNEFNELVYFSL